jgi:hypothetical protein
VNASSTEKSGDSVPDPHSASQQVNWGDFRDHLATADKEGRRRWIYPKKPKGHWYRWRTWMSWALIGIMFAGPFIRINGNPLLMVNVVERRFSILGQIFSPQDTIIFAVAMLVFLTGIILFTTAFGRLWCGWTCPQTVMMEMVFRKIEYLIEGDAHEQRALDASPWTGKKITKKLTKHAVFFGLSFIIGNTLLSYIIGSAERFRIITDNPLNHLVGLSFMILFTLLFYAIFARFREQACTFICPYGRLQSTMLDENTMVVAYDFKRGEKRGPLHRGPHSAVARRSEDFLRRVAAGHHHHSARRARAATSHGPYSSLPSFQRKARPQRASVRQRRRHPAHRRKDSPRRSLEDPSAMDRRWPGIFLC